MDNLLILCNIGFELKLKNLIHPNCMVKNSVQYRHLGLLWIGDVNTKFARQIFQSVVLKSVRIDVLLHHLTLNVSVMLNI